MRRNYSNLGWKRLLIFTTTISLLVVLWFIQPYASEKAAKSTHLNAKATDKLMRSNPIIGCSSNQSGILPGLVSLQGKWHQPKFSPRPKSTYVPSALQGVVPKAPPYKPGEVLVKFKPHTARAASKTILSNLNMQAVKHHGLVDVHLTRTPPGMSVEEAVKKLNKDPSVQYAEPNYIYYAMETIPNDPDFDLLWGLHNTGQTDGTSDADMDAPEAWDLQTGSSEVVIAVIDTGVDYIHEDLLNNMWTNEGETPGDGIDNDGNGYVDDVHGINAIDGSGDPMDDFADVYHGTHCAGTIAAEGNNGIGVAGVCWSAKIMALKSFNERGTGSTDDAVTCIEYMVDMKNNYGVNVKASSNSWGGVGYSHSLYDAISLAKDSDILFIAAAGNAGFDNDMFRIYPAGYDCSNIISVAASDDSDQLAYFSNYGYNSVDVAASGVDIWSTKKGDDYQYLSGTSMATPHVTGLAGLIYAHYSGISYSGVKERIFRTVDEKNYLKDSIASGGRINAYSALTANIQGPYIYPLSPAATRYGYEITIEGAGLGATQGSGYVTFFDNVMASIISWSDRQIVCTVPDGCQEGPVTVTTDEGLESNEKIFSLSGAVSGKVTGKTSGEGIEGVLVAVYDNIGIWINYTDSNGEYSVTGFPTGDYYVQILNYEGYIDEWYGNASGGCDYPPVHVETPNDTPNIDFALVLGGSISGRVTAFPSGEELEKIAVFIFSGDNMMGITSYTDSNGEYSVTGLPTGDYYVFTLNNHGYIDEYYNDALVIVDATIVHVESPNTITNINFILAVGGTVSGQVTADPSGEPIGGVMIMASGSDRVWMNYFTDSNGEYSVTGFPTGDYYVQTFNYEGYIDEYYNDAMDREDATSIHTEEPNNTPGIDFSLTIGGSISGQVTDDSNGEPIRGIMIYLYDRNGPYMSFGITDSSGEYSLTGLPTGDYYVNTQDFYNLGYFQEWYAGVSYWVGDDPPVHVETPNDTPNINFGLALFYEDNYENDDIADQAQFIDTFGTPQNHTLYPAWDEDWVKFEVSNETSYIIETYDLSPECDTYLYLYDTDGSTILEEDDYSGEGSSASKIIYDFPSTGTYYAKVRHDGCSETGSYNFKVSKKCTSDTDCDDGLFCNGVETCVNEVCQAGENPCLPTETCDEESDSCLLPLIIELIPHRAFRSHLIPLPRTMLIVGTDTHFNAATIVNFNSDALTSPLSIVLSQNLIFVFLLINPAGPEATGSTEVEVTVTTTEGIGTEILTLNMLPGFWMSRIK